LPLDRWSRQWLYLPLSRASPHPPAPTSCTLHVPLASPRNIITLKSKSLNRTGITLTCSLFLVRISQKRSQKTKISLLPNATTTKNPYTLALCVAAFNNVPNSVTVVKISANFSPKSSFGQPFFSSDIRFYFLTALPYLLPPAPRTRAAARFPPLILAFCPRMLAHLVGFGAVRSRSSGTRVPHRWVFMAVISVLRVRTRRFSGLQRGTTPGPGQAVSLSSPIHSVPRSKLIFNLQAAL
jgi:hypothetical protein